MNKHREKCDHLKEIRKNMADELGIELNQTVCTYEGECKGTCPKCQQEEQKLSKALLKGTVVAASATVILTGCSIGPVVTEGAVDAIKPPAYTEELDGDVALPEELDDITGLISETELEGEVAYIEEDSE